ncbi:unnamed protein product [Symbiodinium necroappetens]|uniref:Uncharacterized protein n=1 Tax=Symbiodinium necroappetens TaxID=1628268 RepID=A0A812Y2R8_9DINO|nr:unnamed protein product [Symbiodinium necroappetens]
MPVLNLVTSKAEPAASLKRSREEAGVDLTEDGDGEGDVWQQLENELQAPLNLPLAWPAADDASKPREPVVHAVDDKEDSDDDWGYIWKQSGVDAKQTSNILEEIEKNVKAAADFHKEKWQKKEQPEEEEAQEDEEWGAELYETQQEKEISKDFWVPDESWSAWECNSKEAVAAQRLVQKIRSRAAKKDTKAEENTELEDFPSEVLLEVLKLWIGRELPEQRMLLAMLLWVEAITVEVPIVRPDLNQYAMQLLSKEEFQVALRSACDHVSHDVLLVKAGAPIPAAALRNDEAPKVQKRLISSLSGMMQHAEFPMEEDDLTSKFEEIFADLPLSLRVASLAHLNEMAELLKELWASKGEFIEDMKKLASFDRACEVTCRLTLTHAVELGNQALNKDFKDLRVCKVALARDGPQGSFRAYQGATPPEPLTPLSQLCPDDSVLAPASVMPTDMDLQFTLTEALTEISNLSAFESSAGSKSWPEPRTPLQCRRTPSITPLRQPTSLPTGKEGFEQSSATTCNDSSPEGTASSMSLSLEDHNQLAEGAEASPDRGEGRAAARPGEVLLAFT